MNKNVLELNGLCVDYGELRAVKLLDIKINRGERFCLVGESGSDKTSVAMAVAKLLPDSAKVSGAVRMNGTDIYAADEKELREIRRKDLSIIFQDATGSLIPGVTVKKQFYRVIRYRLGISDKEKIGQIAAEHLNRVGLTDHGRILNSWPDELSGGMCQRVVIAMALCVKPALVIAYEPTSALDVITQQKILELLLTLQQDTHFALLFITHDLRIAAHYSNRIGVMQNGSLIETSTTDQFFSKPVNPYSESLVFSAKKLSV